MPETYQEFRNRRANRQGPQRGPGSIGSIQSTGTIRHLEDRVLALEGSISNMEIKINEILTLLKQSLRK